MLHPFEIPSFKIPLQTLAVTVHIVPHSPIDKISLEQSPGMIQHQFTFPTLFRSWFLWFLFTILQLYFPPFRSLTRSSSFLLQGLQPIFKSFLIIIVIIIIPFPILANSHSPFEFQPEFLSKKRPFLGTH